MFQQDCSNGMVAPVFSKAQAIITSVADTFGYSKFALYFVIGTVSDMKYDESERDYVPSVLDLHDTSCVTTGEWFPSQKILPEHLMTVQMRETLQALLADEVSVMLSIAVEFGTVGFNGETVEVKYAGCGKVIAVR